MTRFAYDGFNPAKPPPVGTENFDVFAVLDGSSSLTSRNLHGDKVDQPLARIDGSTAYWPLGDHLGSVRKIIDNTGAVKDAIVYDAYGNIVSETDSTKRGMYSWTGREIDVETGLQYNRARYYDPVTARWISQDPLGFDAGDSNLYRYVANRTNMERDPSGFSWYLLGSRDVPAVKGVGQNTMPRVDYYLSKGNQLDGGSGTWGQPFWTAYGAAGFIQNDDDLYPYRGALSIIKIRTSTPPNAGGHCNTIKAEKDESMNAGHIVAKAVNFPLGTYKVVIGFSFDLSQSKKGLMVVNATAITGNYNKTYTTSVVNSQILESWRKESIRVVGNDGKAVLAEMYPSMANMTGWGRADLRLQIASISRYEPKLPPHLGILPKDYLLKRRFNDNHSGPGPILSDPIP